jgi:ATP-dependent RNA helicase DDX10/DBP4
MHNLYRYNEEEEEDDKDNHQNLSAAAQHALADGPADLGEALRMRAKKGKLRIKAGGQGNMSLKGVDRTVFGDDGEAMKPLEALGQRTLAPVPDGGADLAAAAKLHYDKVRGERLIADKGDRAREKERLRSMRDKAKLKAKKAAGDDDSDGSDSEGGGEMEVTLGGASDSDGDDDDSDSGGGGGGRGQKRGAGGGGGDSSDSSDSDSEGGQQAKRAKRVDVAHAGMALLADEKIESLEERAMRLLQGK